MYIRMFPARNNEIALYNTDLNSPAGKYFSTNANRTIAEKPIATKVKYNFFCLFILSLGLILSFSAMGRIAQDGIASHDSSKHGTGGPMDATENKAVGLLRDQVKGAIQYLEGIMADVAPGEAHWQPPGTALPAGAVYAHVVTAVDAVVNAVLKGGAPLFAAGWAGKTGLSELPPGPDPAKPGFPDWTAWSRRVTIDLTALRRYADAVRAATDDYLATLLDADLARLVDMSSIGMGRVTVGFMLNAAVLGHAFSHAGEIACLKGLQGKTGSQ